MPTVVCPDQRTREVEVVDGRPTVRTPGGSVVSGTVTDGRFRPDSQHHASHFMWYGCLGFHGPGMGRSLGLEAAAPTPAF